LLYTNIYRRFGLGQPDNAGSSELWQRYARGLDSLHNPEDRLAWTLATQLECPVETLPLGQKSFGCFQLELRNEATVVRAHFLNKDKDGLSPLHPSKVTKRQGELKALFAFVKANHASAQSVMGVSWLYNLEAYRRLFPVAYGDSRQLRTEVWRFQGSSSWGQFLDYQGRLKPEPRAEFLHNLKHLDTARLWEVFPLPTLTVSLPIQEFYAYFEV
jgi:hypothetical protein